jgi:hypothetical protein
MNRRSLQPSPVLPAPASIATGSNTSEWVRRPQRLFDAYVFDLDDTVYLGDALLPGSGEAIHDLLPPGA